MFAIYCGRSAIEQAEPIRFSLHGHRPPGSRLEFTAATKLVRLWPIRSLGSVL